MIIVNKEHNDAYGQPLHNAEMTKLLRHMRICMKQ